MQGISLVGVVVARGVLGARTLVGVGRGGGAAVTVAGALLRAGHAVARQRGVANVATAGRRP